MEDRGRGYGREAIALLASHLFGELGAARVQATTPVANAPMRVVLERLAFREEGTLRAFLPGPRGGRLDAVMYGLTRPDWAAREFG